MDTFHAFLRRKRGDRTQASVVEALQGLQINQSRLSEMERGRVIPDRAQEAAMAAALVMTDEERATWGALIVEAEMARRGMTLPPSPDADQPERAAS